VPELVDLRSDTVTQPTAAMRAAMAAAEVGDDVYGEDPTVTALENRVAALLGHEAGVFTPSGSLANQLGLRLLVRPGQELVCDDDAHVVRAELGAAAALSGITTRTWKATRGLLDVADVRRIIRPDAGPYLVSTVAVEQTHNRGGGAVYPLAALKELRALTSSYGIAFHCDGARIWNAHVASGISFQEYGALFDTVSVCLSKGLGAPVGSLLASTASRVAEARVWRKRYGAGMRQVGILAAAGLHALDHHLDRLAEDHRHARQLADAIAAAAPSTVTPEHVETNIVPLDLTGHRLDAAGLASAARERGVLVSALGPRFCRLVTHLDVDDAATERASAVLASVLG
jgi:threonine aldolase